MRGALQHAERPSHRRRPHALLRRPLVRVARRDEQPIDVAAEAVFVLRVRDRRAQHLRDVVGDSFARVLQRRERAVDVLAADQTEHEPGLLRRGPHVPSSGLRLNHDELPAPAGFAPPPPAPPPAPAGADGAPGPPGAPGAPAAPAAASAAARSATRVVWPLQIRVGANSPSLCPTMFSVTYTGTNLRPLCTASVCPTISGTTVERRDQVLMTFFSFARFITYTFSRRCVSTNGPFFSERPILFPVVASSQWSVASTAKSYWPPATGH